MNAATQPEDANSFPPTLPPLMVLGLTIISFGIFLWIWPLLWGHWIKKKKPDSIVSTMVYINIVLGALLFINFPSLLLATREKDATEIARLHISIVLWGVIAGACLVATWITIYLTQRKIK